MKRNKSLPIIATLGSHSALDVCSGAKMHAFKTLVVAARGREKTYTEYFYRKGKTGCVDEVILLDSFDEILHEKIQKKLQKKSLVFLPNRSFEVYLRSDYDAIENDFHVPIFGNKYLLRMEERTGAMTQYAILAKAGIRAPKEFSNPESIDRLCIVKVGQKEKSFERAFFFVSTPKEFRKEFALRVKNGRIDKKASVRIEEYVLGAQVNLNFFYSPLDKKLELLGTDTRRQTNISGFLSLPARHQLLISDSTNMTFEEAGHNAVTILESMLEPAFELGERFVTACKTFHPKGIIGPFSLQCSIVPTANGKEFVVFDVSPRMPGSPGISATPYTTYRYGKPMSVGERCALEIKKAVILDQLNKVTT